jgi:hypothetical protein
MQIPCGPVQMIGVCVTHWADVSTGPRREKPAENRHLYRRPSKMPAGPPRPAGLCTAELHTSSDDRPIGLHLHRYSLCASLIIIGSHISLTCEKPEAKSHSRHTEGPAEK